MSSHLARLTKRFSRIAIKRGKAIRRAADDFELVFFGHVDRDDDVSPIRGFTASTTHIDQHFCVGSFEGYSIRLVDRFDITKTHPADIEHTWLIVEISLETSDLPHVCMVPTGRPSHEYQRLFRTHSHLQPLNSTLLSQHSREIHGRFQILSATTNYHAVEQLLDSPLVVGVSARFWPHGIEIKDDKLFVYITDHLLTREMVSSTIASSLWLANHIDRTQESS